MGEDFKLKSVSIKPIAIGNDRRVSVGRWLITIEKRG